MFNFVIDQELFNKGLDHNTMVKHLTDYDVHALGGFANECIRVVTHRDVTRSDLEYTRDCIGKIIKQYQ
jgi:hypothetical protein